MALVAVMALAVTLRKTSNDREESPVSNRPSVQAEIERPALDQMDAERKSKFLASISAELPRLRAPGLSDFERVTLLREWAWGHTDCVADADASNLIDHRSAEWDQPVAAADIYEEFERDRGGVLCGGTAKALMRLYELFGYRAWTINSGVDGMTHEVTLVEIQTPGGPCRCAQGSYLNVTYVDADTNEPLDYFDLVSRLAHRRHETVKVLESDYRRIRPRPALLIAADDLHDRDAAWYAQNCFNVLESDYRADKLPFGLLKITSPRTYGGFVAMCRDEQNQTPRWYLKPLTDRGHPAELSYIFLYPLDVKGPDHDLILERACEIAAGDDP